MRGENRIYGALMVALLPVFGGGCVAEQHGEFRGILSHGAGGTNAPRVQPIGAEFQLLPKTSAAALTGYCLSPSRVVIVWVHDRQKYVSHDYRLSNDAVEAVYYSERSSNDPVWMAFLREDVVARDRSDGIHRLQGSFNVEKWRSNIDFRIRLAMQSAGPDSLKLDGILTTYNRWGFHPWQGVGIILGSMGLVNEGARGPKATAQP